jgi:hypothetical protein
MREERAEGGIDGFVADRAPIPAGGQLQAAGVPRFQPDLTVELVRVNPVLPLPETNSNLWPAGLTHRSLSGLHVSLLQSRRPQGSAHNV